MLIGALVACTPLASPSAIATLTLVPATDTPTSAPVTATLAPSPTSTLLPLTASPSLTPITPLLVSSLSPDREHVEAWISELAARLAIDESRIQLGLIEEFTWLQTNQRCGATNPLPEVTESDELVAGLRYIFVVGDAAYEYHLSPNGESFRCPRSQQIQGALLLAIDPLAGEMLFLAQRAVAQELDLSTRRVELVQIAPYIWYDTSLGCPRANQTYQAVEILGYRIVVQAAERNYIFHTDSISVFPCDARNEELAD